MPRKPPTELCLAVLDAEDMAVVSAHLQDAVLKVADMAYLPNERRFAAVLNRFDWTAAESAGPPSSRLAGRRKTFLRRRSGLRFERVTGAKLSGFDQRSGRQALSLLAIQFDATSPPAGLVTLVFAGGAAVRLEVECLEAEMRDLGGAWATRRKPEHALADAKDQS